jgi:hypothetical protein
MGDVVTMPMAGAPVLPPAPAPVPVPMMGEPVPAVELTGEVAPPVRKVMGRLAVKGKIVIKKDAPR